MSEILDELAELNPDALLADGLEDALVGYTVNHHHATVARSTTLASASTCWWPETECRRRMPTSTCRSTRWEPTSARTVLCM